MYEYVDCITAVSLDVCLVFSNSITYGIVCKCNRIYQQYLFGWIIVFWYELDLLICKFSEGVVQYIPRIWFY